MEFYSQRGYSEDVRQICLRMHRSGINFHEIERLTGINHNTVINWVKQQELSSMLSMDDDALLSS
ncbi:MAG: hypothetical protein Fur0046_39570 [Cyanobacteria bacterium J069]|nr:MAG: hypothetical protein D6742_20255 [Cyanobacteria bacterium J069]